MSERNFVYSKDLERSCGQYSVTNCRCDVSAFDLRKSMWRLSKIDVSPLELFQPLEDAIRLQLLPALTGKAGLTDSERGLLELPARLGGLGVVNPVRAATIQLKPDNRPFG